MNSPNEFKCQKGKDDYSIYLRLKKLKYTNADIAKQLNYSQEELGYLISGNYFKHNIEYQLQEIEGSYFFNGNFYITGSVKEVLQEEEIIEIYQFVQDLTIQHNGIDYLQTFYHVEQDCKLFFIDQLNTQMIKSNQYSEEDNYCTLMLSGDY